MTSIGGPDCGEAEARHGARTQMSEAPERYLGWREVQPLFGGISRTTAWRGVRDGWLPRPVNVSPGRQAWRWSDIVDWQSGLRNRRPPRLLSDEAVSAP